MQQPHDGLFALAHGWIAPRCLHVIAELGVADHIGEQPISVEKLASACGANAEALERMLRLLAAHGVFAAQVGAWVHTPSSRLLCAEHPLSMRPFVRLLNQPIYHKASSALEHSVRTGAPAVETFEPRGGWAYLSDHPEEAEIFNQAMTAKAAGDTSAVLNAYDFTRFTTIADIGAGRGHLLRAVLDAAPTARGVLFDLPDVIAAADVEHPRLTAQAGDFFSDSLPAADAYILMEVLHDWSDRDAIEILSAVRTAARADATLLVIEGLLPDEGTDPVALSMDVMMLFMLGGRERNPSQFRGLFNEAGFKLKRVVDTGTRMRIVEATAS